MFLKRLRASVPLERSKGRGSRRVGLGVEEEDYCDCMMPCVAGELMEAEGGTL